MMSALVAPFVKYHPIVPPLLVSRRGWCYCPLLLASDWLSKSPSGRGSLAARSERPGWDGTSSSGRPVPSPVEHDACSLCPVASWSVAVLLWLHAGVWHLTKVLFFCLGFFPLF